MSYSPWTGRSRPSLLTRAFSLPTAKLVLPSLRFAGVAEGAKEALTPPRELQSGASPRWMISRSPDRDNPHSAPSVSRQTRVDVGDLSPARSRGPNDAEVYRSTPRAVRDAAVPQVASVAASSTGPRGPEGDVSAGGVPVPDLGTDRTPRGRISGRRLLLLATVIIVVVLPILIVFAAGGR